MSFFLKLPLRQKIFLGIVGATFIGHFLSEIGAMIVLGESIDWQSAAVEETISLAIAAAIGFVLANAISRPLQQAARNITSLRDGDYDAVVSEPTGGSALLDNVTQAVSDLRERMIRSEKEAQDALFKSAGFERASSALMMADKEMRIIHMNEAFRSLFADHARELAPKWADKGADALIGQSMDLFHKNPAATRSRVADPASFPLRTEIVLPSERIGLIISIVEGEDGEVAGYYLEWELVTRRAIQKGLLQGMEETQCVISYSTKGKIIEVNDGFCQSMGYAKEDLIGRSFEDFIDPAERQSPKYKEMTKALLDGKPYKGVIPRISKAGEVVWVDSVFNHIRDYQGQRMRVIEVGTDITDQRNVLLRREATLNGINDGSAVIEFKPDGTIIRANKNFRNTMGYELEEIVGQHHRMFAPKGVADSPEYEEHWRKLRAGETVGGTFERVTKSGKTVYILGAYAPVKDEQGAVKGVIKVVTDITEAEIARRQSEAEASHAAQAAAETVKVLGAALSELAEGDLRNTLNESFEGSYDQLRQDFNAAVSSLAEVVVSVVDRAESMKGGATEVSRAASDLSRRTESQAATLEETAASLKQLTETLRESAKSSDEANGFTASAADKASSGEDIMRRSLEAMRQIEDSSSQISTIIGVIDDIAFQTNLLALNAGVEAARAGDAGRGFAVVASEVRALAQRSAEAARDIKQLISTSSVHVSDGVGLASDAGEALQDIISDVQRIKDVVKDLAESGKTQADNVSEIMAAMEQLDGVTQSNAAMVQEMTAASVDLNSEVNALSDRVAHFKTARSGGAKPAAAAPVAAKKANAPARTAKQDEPRRAAAAVAGSSALKLDESDGWEEF